MKRLVLALLFGASFALHDWSHAQVAAPQHELCAVSVSPAQVPLVQPEVVSLSQERFELTAAQAAVRRDAISSSASARAPPASLLS